MLAALGLAIYSNTFRSSFVFDDFQAITSNPSIRHLDLPLLWQAFNTRFIVGVSLALNYALGKENVVGYHLFNTLVHVLNSYLVYQFVCLTFKTPRMSKSSSFDPKLLGFLTALIFLTHPLQTQGVTYIWQRATSLATFFYLGALVFYIQGRLKSSRVSYGFCLLFVILGMFTKEIVFTLPLALGLYEVIFLKELPLKTRQKVFLWVPLCLTLLIIPWGMTKADGHILKFLRPNNIYFNPGHERNLIKDLLQMTRTTSEDKMPRREFVLTELNVLRTYLRLFILPIHQSVDYDYPKARSLMEPNTFLSFILLVSLLGGAFLLLKKHPLLAFGIFWFFLTVSVEALVAQEEFIFEHRMYLPMVGLSLFLVTGVSSFFKNSPRKLTLLILGVVASYSFLTYQRNFVWRDEFTLWDDAVRKSPKKGRPYNNRGYAYEKMGLFEKALADSNKAIKINPNATSGYNNRGISYKNKGNIDQALTDFNKAIELQPDNAEAYSNRGSIYERKGLLDQALADCSKAIKINPNMASAYSNRSLVYRKKGYLDKALADCNKAIEIDPKMASAYINRAVVYRNKGLLDQALHDFNKAIQLEPNNAEAYSNRASIYEKKGLLDNALADCNRAIALDAKVTGAYNNRGVCYRRKGLQDQALLDFNKAIELEPNNSDAYSNRGSVYGSKGFLDQALSDFNKALQLRPNFPEAYNNRAFVHFLKKEYTQSWQDLTKAQSLGFAVNPELIEKLKKARSLSSQ